MAFPFYGYQQPNNNNNQQMQMQQQNQPQIQTCGCIMVMSEEEVNRYPVALNTAMAFILQDLSACYIKAMGASMLDVPRIARYTRDTTQETPLNGSQSDFANKADENTAFALKTDIEQIQGQIDTLTEQIKPLLNSKPKKAEVKADE